MQSENSTLQASSTARRVTLKRDDLFLLCDARGDIVPERDASHGLYDRDTRVLSRLELAIDGARYGTARTVGLDDGAGLLTRYACVVEGQPLGLRRRRFLHADACFERVVLRNAGRRAVGLRLTLRYAADFADIFEVRGQTRKRRGTRTATCDAADRVAMHYHALDGVMLRTCLRFEPAPDSIGGDAAAFEVTLPPGTRWTLFVQIVHEDAADAAPAPGRAFGRNLRRAARQRRSVLAQRVDVSTDHPLFDTVFRQAYSDLRMLTTRTPQGLYPYAGTPWFSTPFGRDGLVTALLTLWMAPALARGVLDFLAFHQATEEDPSRDAQPGKILHEMRQGEMARLGEVPFGRYYGSVDSTPLFVLLLGAYYERTGDLQTVRRLWPNAAAALDWIDRYGDVDGDGFVEYFRQTEGGLANQGWKDSSDAIFHRDGRLATGPVALCEVQGYVYGARRAAATLASALGLPARAEALTVQAETLRERFEAAFWREEIDTYALALDGDKRPCDVVSSNAGQVLLSGIADPAHARRVAEGLWSPDCYSGWGVRTVARSSARYAPDSYHDGSVWPHDNAMIALGLSRYRIGAPVARVLSDLFDAAAADADYRLPELIRGDPRQPGRPPPRYPVACSPQAWASAALPSLLQTCLGLSWDAARRELRLVHPRLPAFLNTLTLRRLTLGDARIDLRLTRDGDGVAVETLARHGDLHLDVPAD